MTTPIRAMSLCRPVLVEPMRRWCSRRTEQAPRSRRRLKWKQHVNNGHCCSLRHHTAWRCVLARHSTCQPVGFIVSRRTAATHLPPPLLLHHHPTMHCTLLWTTGYHTFYNFYCECVCVFCSPFQSLLLLLVSSGTASRRFVRETMASIRSSKSKFVELMSHRLFFAAQMETIVVCRWCWCQRLTWRLLQILFVAQPFGIIFQFSWICWCLWIKFVFFFQKFI